MAIDYQIKDEKVQYNINREAAKLSALSSGKIEKYKYLTCKEIVPSNQKQIIEQAKFNLKQANLFWEKILKKKQKQLKIKEKIKSVR